jgi:tetratricopeptide (TPR) repeat protein
MRAKLTAIVIASMSVLFAQACVGLALASDNPVLDAQILKIANGWASAKYEIKDQANQDKAMEALNHEAAALMARYPGRAEPMIWDGVLLSERASNASPFSALGLAKRALAVLQKAESVDPKALDAGAPTSLGVLYYRVPGFPIGFGDKAKARHYLEQAVKNAPEGLDAWYFYGDFLNEQGEYPQAAQALQHMLALPKHPDRPVWDKYRRIVAEQLLEKIWTHLQRR